MNKKEAIDELKKHKVGFGEVASVRIDRAVSAGSRSIYDLRQLRGGNR